MRAALLAIVALCACSQGGCSQAPLTEVLVVADTDLEVPSELTEVRFEVTGPRGDVQRASADFAAGDARPAVLALVHRDGPLGPFTVEVIGERGAAEVVRRTARLTLVAGEVRALEGTLRRACAGVACGEGETCGDAGCRAIDVAPSELEPWNGPPPGVDAGTPAPEAGPSCSCDDGVACTVDVCRDGGCAHVPDSSACADDGHACTSAMCDPERGCVHVPDDGACDDGVGCTIDRCELERGCTATAHDAVCGDGVSCTTDRCDLALGCTSIGDDAACDDGVACTADRCGARGCARDAVHASCPDGERCDADDGCERGPTFTEVYAFFERRCTSCHTEANPHGGLDLSSAAQAWTSLVGIESTCGASLRVAPRDPRASLLWRKLARVDLCGERMPPSGPPTATSDTTLVERWIEAGALND